MALPILGENVYQNVQGGDNSNVSYNVSIKELDWGKDLHLFRETYQVIIGADIIYIEETFPDLIKTLLHLSDEKTIILLSCKIRYDRDRRFLALLEESFSVELLLHENNRDIYIYSATKDKTRS